MSTVKISRSKIKLLQKLKYLPPPSIVAEPYCRINKHNLHEDLEYLLKYSCLEKEDFFGMKVPCKHLCWGLYRHHPTFAVTNTPKDLAELMGWDKEAHDREILKWYAKDAWPTGLWEKEFGADEENSKSSKNSGSIF